MARLYSCNHHHHIFPNAAQPLPIPAITTRRSASKIRCFPTAVLVSRRRRRRWTSPASPENQRWSTDSPPSPSSNTALVVLVAASSLRTYRNSATARLARDPHRRWREAARGTQRLLPTLRSHSGGLGNFLRGLPRSVGSSPPPSFDWTSSRPSKGHGHLSSRSVCKQPIHVHGTVRNFRVALSHAAVPTLRRCVLLSLPV